MENFVFALNATVPIFLVILLGFFLRKIGMLNDGFCKTADQYVFKVALPVSLFKSISTMDLYTDFSLSFCLFCALSTVAMFMGVWYLVFKLLKTKSYIGAFSQASVRSSAAILGLALATNIYGHVGLVPMMIVASVPLFNILSVVILTFSPQSDENGNLLPSPENGMQRIKNACINVAKNPIILGILLGIPFALLRVNLPTFLTTAISNVGNTATPIALLVVGASFSGGQALKRLKPAAVASLIKLMVLPLIFLPIAALLGFRNSEMIAVLIMTGSPTTVTCYVMARAMRQDTVLSSNVIMLTTLFSSVSITFWLFILRSLNLV